MNQPRPPQDDWQACQPGEVGRLVHGLKTHRRSVATRRQFSVAVMVLLIAVSAVTGYYAVSVPPVAEPNYGGIVCSRVLELAPQWLANALDAETVGRIERHLAHCPSCRHRIDAMKAMPVSQSRPAPPPQGVARSNHDADSPKRPPPNPPPPVRLANLTR